MFVTDLWPAPGQRSAPALIGWEVCRAEAVSEGAGWRLAAAAVETHQRTSAGNFTVLVECVRNASPVLPSAGLSRTHGWGSVCSYRRLCPLRSVFTVAGSHQGHRLKHTVRQWLSSCFYSHLCLFMLKISSGVKYHSCAKLNHVLVHMIYQQQKQLVNAKVYPRKSLMSSSAGEASGHRSASCVV